MPTKAKDPFVLQHEHWGTIHQLRKDGKAFCGNGNNGGLYKRRRLSKAMAHPKAHHCETPGKCEAHRT